MSAKIVARPFDELAEQLKKDPDVQWLRGDDACKPFTRKCGSRRQRQLAVDYEQWRRDRQSRPSITQRERRAIISACVSRVTSKRTGPVPILSSRPRG